MKVLVINSGSSSIKYQLLNMEDETVMCSGLVERIGEDVSVLSHKAYPDTAAEKKTKIEEKIADHGTGMHLVADLLTDSENGVIKDRSEISAIGHRVVHGAETFTQPTLIDDEVIKGIKACSPLSPLHNPANLTGIEVAQALFKGVPQVAVFDTNFHQTMPSKAYIYPLPYELYTENRVRRYGFHGTSHKFIASECAKLMGKKLEDCNLITVHLGNGGSIAAVKNGKCVDTSMGMTPLAGIMMGTRCGDIDPAIHTYLAETKGMTIKEIDNLLNKQSGLKGVCGMNDMRDIHAKIKEGDEKAKLALDMFTYRIKKYIGSYAAVLGRIDAVIFTAGIGENDDVAREMICEDMSILGMEMDSSKNKGRAKESKAVHVDSSKVQIWVIPTNEELQIAKETLENLNNK